MKKQNTSIKNKKNNNKVVKPADRKFTYKNVSSTTINDKAKIEAFIKKENARVSERMKERKIKLTDVIKINKFHQQQFLNGKLKGDFIRYWFFLKNGKKQMFNFSKSFKVESK
jgi:hypothetical protein